MLSPLSTPVSRKVTSGSLHRARTVRSALRLGWLALGLGLVGCPGGPDGPLRQLEVGTGVVFTPIEEGSTLELNAGGQGGQHVFVSLRVWELDTMKARVKMSLERVSDGERLAAPYSVNLRFDRGLREGEPAKLEGLLLVVDDPFEAVDREVRLNASFESEDGEHGSDSRTGTLQWTETPLP